MPLEPFEIALADEARHRHANEFAAALATLHLLKAKEGAAGPLLEDAIARLEGAVSLERHLNCCGTPDLYEAIYKLCSLLRRTRPLAPPCRLHFDEFPRIPDATSMKLLLLIAYELLINAMKHSRSVKMPVRVHLKMRESAIRIKVSNWTCDVPENVGSNGSGLIIAKQIAAHMGGAIEVRIRGRTHIVTAIFPFLFRSSRKLKRDSPRDSCEE